MSSNITIDLYESYIKEVITPQLGKKTSGAPSGENKSADPNASSEKKIRQAVYDIRYRARRENVPIQSAFSQYMAHSSLSSSERMIVREKLGLSKSSASSVDEEYIDEAPHYNKYNSNTKKYKVRVTDKLSGKTYVRYATREKISKLRSNPNISSVEMTQYGDPYEGEKSKGEQTSKTTSGKGLDPVGKEDKKGDLDNDGIPASKDKNDQYLLNRRKVISNKINKQNSKVKIKEDFSDWRNDLFEVVEDDIKNQEKTQVKEKKVSNNIIINPEINIEQVQVLESIQISEEYLSEAIDISTEYFYEQGLNEHGVQILIDEIGEDSFCEWVFDITNDSLLIERKLRAGETALPAKTRERITKKPVSRKSVSDLKGGPAATKERSDKARREARTAVRQTPEPTERQKTLARLQDAQRKRNIEKAKSNQTPTTKEKPTKTKSGIASRISSALKYAGERAKQDTAKVARAAGTAAGVVHGAGIVAHRLGKEAGKSKTGQAIKKNLGISEEAESEQQQKLFGLALSVKRGQTPRSEVSAEVLKIVDTMSEKQIRKYAKTKHAGIPKKVDEAVAQIPGRENNPPARTTGTQDDVQKQQLANQKRMLDKERQLDLQVLKLKRNNKLPMGHATEEVEYIDELRRSEKEGKGSPEMRTKSGHLVGARGERKRKGEMGGRHFYSGGEGGSRTERGKKKGEKGSQHQRLNPETQSRVQQIIKNRESKMSSRFD